MINTFNFMILENDIDYINYLIYSYKQFVPCIYKDHLKDINAIDIDKIRAIYYFYPTQHGPKKTIFFSKNIKTLGIHKVEKTFQDTWIMNPPAINGHFCSHYRIEQKDYKIKVVEPIRNLNIDFEYLTFILKRYTNFC